MSLKKVIRDLEKIEYSAFECWNGSWSLSCNKLILCTGANEEIVKEMQRELNNVISDYVDHLKSLEVPKQLQTKMEV